METYYGTPTMNKTNDLIGVKSLIRNKCTSYFYLLNLTYISNELYNKVYKKELIVYNGNLQ